MVRWCAQAGQAGSYYQYHHVGRVGKVPWTRAVFFCAFLQGFGKTAQCVDNGESFIAVLSAYRRGRDQGLWLDSFYTR